MSAHIEEAVTLGEPNYNMKMKFSSHLVCLRRYRNVLRLTSRHILSQNGSKIASYVSFQTDGKEYTLTAKNETTSSASIVNFDIRTILDFLSSAQVPILQFQPLQLAYF